MEQLPDTFSYLSTGDVFRALSSTPNAIGDYVSDRIKRGELIDNKVTNAIFESYYFTVADSGKHMLLDGYPRSEDQMRMMLAFLSHQSRKVLGIHFTLDDTTATERMLARGRGDDTLDSITSRISQFKNTTLPMINLFAAHFPMVEIDASASIDVIHGLVMQQL